MNIYQGDPAIKITENGADLKFIGGQPVMDQGIENAVLISLFTEPGYWGNILESEDSKKIGSDWQSRKNEPITATSLADDQNAGERALQWMRTTRLAQFTVSVVNPSGIIRNALFRIQPPGSDIEELLVSRNGSNWNAQAVNPAHIRIDK